MQKEYNVKDLNKCYVKDDIIYRSKKNYKQLFIPNEIAKKELKKIHIQFGHIGRH